MTGILFFLKRIFYFVIDNWRLVAAVTGIVLVVALTIGFLRGCGSNKPKLDERSIQEAQIAIEQRNEQKLKEILVNSDVREQQIDANVANGRVATLEAAAEAKKRYEAMTFDELAKELEARK